MKRLLGGGGGREMDGWMDGLFWGLDREVGIFIVFSLFFCGVFRRMVVAS